LAAIGVYFGRRKRVATVIRDASWAFGELQSAQLTADRCATILRQYVAFLLGLPADARTTPELAAVLRTDGRLSANRIIDWRALLEECDAARFSGTELAVAGLADRARQLIEATEEDCTSQTRQSTPTSQVAEID
jgi:hypothetical protein